MSRKMGETREDRARLLGYEVEDLTKLLMHMMMNGDISAKVYGEVLAELAQWVKAFTARLEEGRKNAD